MTTLVTGAAGFIGSTLVERLLAAGQEVVGLDNFDDFYSPSLKRRNIAAALRSARFRLVEGDFRDASLLEQVFSASRPAAVVHLGARAGVRPSLLQAPLYTDVNVTGTARILDAAVRHGTTRLVFASSSSVYGKRPLAPFTEDDDTDHPISPYAATKRAGEHLCWTYHHLYGISVSCLRFFTVYGPRQRPEMAIHAFARSIARGEPVSVWGDGRVERDFTYIADIASGVEAALDRCSGYRVYNLGRGESVVLLDVIRALEVEIGRPALIEHLPAQPGDVPVTLANVDRARRDLGFAPQVSIPQGVRLFVAWLRENSLAEDAPSQAEPRA